MIVVLYLDEFLRLLAVPTLGVPMVLVLLHVNVPHPYVRTALAQGLQLRLVMDQGQQKVVLQKPGTEERNAVVREAKLEESIPHQARSVV